MGERLAASPDELQRLQKAAREAGGEMVEQAGEPEQKKTGESSKEGEAKPKQKHTHKH